MIKSKIPKPLLIGLLMLVAASAWATQVKMGTFTSGLSQAGNGIHGVKVSAGVPFGGKTDPAPGQSGAMFGFWAMLSKYRDVSPVPGELPQVQNQLFRNYPNPFNPSTEISFALAHEAEVRIDLYDLRGLKVDLLFEGIMPAGAHTFTYQPRNLASGAYVVMMRAGSFRATQRIMLLK